MNEAVVKHLENTHIHNLERIKVFTNRNQLVMSTELMIKKLLLDGKVLTSCTAARTFHTADLRKYISNLRKSGMPINDSVVRTKSGKWYKRYWYAGGSENKA